MKKIINIALKDILVAFRDPTSLLIMLVSPLALTLVIAFAFGGSSGSSGLKDIPVIIVNQDTGTFGPIFDETFRSPDLADLIEPAFDDDIAAAKTAVDNGQAAAAVIVPADLSDSILPSEFGPGQPAGSTDSPQSVIEIYADPSRPVGSGVIRSIVAEILGSINAGRAGGTVAVTQLMTSGLLSPVQAQAQGSEIGYRAGDRTIQENLVDVVGEYGEAREQEGFNWLAYSAPSMAILFLMFTISSSSRTFLSEREWGTLPRMLVTPSTNTQVICGKVTGLFLTGTAQLLILYLSSRLLFGVSWGEPLAVVIVILAIAAAATGWGILLAAYARTPGQVGAYGSALTLLFGALAGNFIPRAALPEWLRTAGLITPNAWGLDAFTSLTQGGTLQDVSVQIIALFGMAIVLFIAAAIGFRRQFTA